MSTLALADLGPGARRRLGLEPRCADPCPGLREVVAGAASAPRTTALARLPLLQIASTMPVHGTIPSWLSRCPTGPNPETDSEQAMEHRTVMNDPLDSPTETPRLFGVCLGGSAPRSRVELHDVAFAIGHDLESIHHQLLDQWFGSPEGLHVDAWAVLDRVPGYRVELARGKAAEGPRLYFVNIGGYRRGEFGERHAWAFYAGSSPAEVKAKARRELLPGKDSVHRDDLYAVDDLIEVVPGHGWSLRLVADAEAGAPAVTNGYFPIPRRTISAWQRGRKRAGSSGAGGA